MDIINLERSLRTEREKKEKMHETETKGISFLIEKGFPRDQAVKIYFASHPEYKFDPSADYNFDPEILNDEVKDSQEEQKRSKELELEAQQEPNILQKKETAESNTFENIYKDNHATETVPTPRAPSPLYRPPPNNGTSRLNEIVDNTHVKGSNPLYSSRDNTPNKGRGSFGEESLGPNERVNPPLHGSRDNTPSKGRGGFGKESVGGPKAPELTFHQRKQRLIAQGYSASEAEKLIISGRVKSEDLPPPKPPSGRFSPNSIEPRDQQWTSEDESEVQHLMRRGYSRDQAVDMRLGPSRSRTSSANDSISFQQPSPPHPPRYSGKPSSMMAPHPGDSRGPPPPDYHGYPPRVNYTPERGRPVPAPQYSMDARPQSYGGMTTRGEALVNERDYIGVEGSYSEDYSEESFVITYDQLAPEDQYRVQKYIRRGFPPDQAMEMFLRKHPRGPRRRHRHHRNRSEQQNSVSGFVDPRMAPLASSPLKPLPSKAYQEQQRFLSRSGSFFTNSVDTPVQSPAKPSAGPVPTTAVAAATELNVNVDDIALQMALLISQQEAQFGFNMYDVLTPADEPELQELTEQGKSRDNAILELFEKKGFKVEVPTAEPMVAAPAELSHANSSTSQIGNFSRENSSTSTVDGTPNKSGKRGLFSRLFSSTASVTKVKGDEKKQGPEETEEERRLRRALKYKESDVKVLMGMGFSRDLSIQALVQSNNNLQKAISSLSTY